MDDRLAKASTYWASIPATIDGVLGGFGYISDVDIQGSEMFIKKLKLSKQKPLRAVDCGAGIGRITKLLLSRIFDIVDVVEPDIKFLQTIPKFVGDDAEKLGELYNCTLQDFQPKHKYSVIWIQWVLGHMSDDELIAYLCKCREYLMEDGLIIIKENVTSSGEVERDETDSAITRPLSHYIRIFKSAKLKRIKQSKQTNFPEGIYPVYIFALVPFTCHSPDSGENKNNSNKQLNN